MKRSSPQFLCIALIMSVALIGVAGCSGTSSTPPPATTSTAAMSLTDSLGSLGLTADQAAGAVGSYLGYAQAKLPASDFTKVAAVVPNSDQYVKKAKDLGVGDLTSVTDLNAAYGKLGISPEVAAKVTPTVTNYIGKAGGSSVQSMLSGIMQ